MTEKNQGIVPGSRPPSGRKRCADALKHFLFAMLSSYDYAHQQKSTEVVKMITYLRNMSMLTTRI